jgi:hypothetical protein
MGKKTSEKMRLLFPFLVTVVIWMAAITRFAFASASTARLSFPVKPGDEGAQALKITTNDGETVSCSFKYSTKRRSSNDDEQKEASNAGVRRPSVQSILGRLSGICIRKTIDYWKYELCFEGEIKQVHGQIQHNMGRYAGLEGPIQMYDEGTPCESKNEKKGRRSRVEFLCDKQLRVRSVEEVATCSYLILVGTPIVCGSADFANAPNDGELDSSSTQNQDELWYLELAQVGKGRVECSARALTGDVRARPERPSLTTLEFSRFDLEINAATDSPATLHHDLHVVRAPDRVRLSPSEREYSLVSNSGSSRDRRIALRSGDSFLGLLEFVNLLVRIVDPNSAGVIV